MVVTVEERSSKGENSGNSEHQAKITSTHRNMLLENESHTALHIDYKVKIHLKIISKTFLSPVKR